jgi:hypothetical protein
MDPSEASPYETVQSNAVVTHSCHTVTSQGVIFVAAALRLNSTLVRLSLIGSRINDSGAAAIADSLKLNSTLQELVLGWNCIGDVGAVAIAEALKLNTSLQKLSLNDNLIKDSGATAIAEALKLNTSLQKLSLNVNLIKDSGATAIAGALQRNSTLLQLNLEGKSITDLGVKAIVESLELSFLLEQNVNVPVVCLSTKNEKLRFLNALSKGGFKSFIANDVPPALCPHALAKVSTYPSLMFHLLRQVSRSNFGEMELSNSSKKVSPNSCAVTKVPARSNRRSGEAQDTNDRKFPKY